MYSRGDVHDATPPAFVPNQSFMSTPSFVAGTGVSTPLNEAMRQYSDNIPSPTGTEREVIK